MSCSYLERLMLRLLQTQCYTKCLKGMWYWLVLDLVIMLVTFLTQWDFFHHDKATKFLLLEGDIQILFKRSSDIVRRGSWKPECWVFTQLNSDVQHAPCFSCGVKLQKHIFRSLYWKISFLPPLTCGGDGSGYRNSLILMGCVGFGKCYGGKRTLMSLSDLTGWRARVASFPSLFNQ